MEEMVYNKLVSDIIDIIKANGGSPTYKILNDEEFIAHLLNKEIEKINEVREATTIEELKEEIADVYEVFRTIVKYFGFTEEEIKEAADKKLILREEIFDKKIFLKKVTKED